MKHFASIACCCMFLVFQGNTQEFSRQLTVSVFTGMINYQGDLNPNSFTFKRSHFSAGLTLKKPLNRWFTARAGLMTGKIEAADRDNREYLKPRNLSFYNSITEANLGLDLNVLDISTKHFTPYMYGGIAVFLSNPWTYDNNGIKTFLQPLSTEGQGLPQYPGQKPYGKINWALMFGGGFKIAVNQSVSVGIEFSQRKSFTDYIDDVSTHFVDRDLLLLAKGPKAVELSYRGDEVPGGVQSFPVHGEQRGTPSEMDWYYYLGTTIEVRFNAIGDLFKSMGSGLHGSYSHRCPRNPGY